MAGSWWEGQEEREAVGFLDDLRTIWLLILTGAFAKEAVAAAHKHGKILQRGWFNENNNLSCDSSQEFYPTSTTGQNLLLGFSISSVWHWESSRPWAEKKNQVLAVLSMKKWRFALPTSSHHTCQLCWARAATRQGYLMYPLPFQLKEQCHKCN